MLDKDGNGDISRSEIKTVILKTYKERRFLAKSMQFVLVLLLLPDLGIANHHSSPSAL